MKTVLTNWHRKSAEEKRFFLDVQYLSYLEKRNRVSEIHSFLREENAPFQENDRFTNSWYEARETYGDTEGYLRDIQLAWECTKEAYDPDNTSTGYNIGLQCRYALITSSINSLAENIHPLLLAALQRVWPRNKIISHIQHIHDPIHRVWSLIAVNLVFRDNEQLEKALDEIRKNIKKIDAAQVRDISNLLPHLGTETVLKIWEWTLTLPSSVRDRAELFVAFVPYMPYEKQVLTVKETWKAIQEIPFINPDRQTLEDTLSPFLIDSSSSNTPEPKLLTKDEYWEQQACALYRFILEPEGFWDYIPGFSSLKGHLIKKAYDCAHNINDGLRKVRIVIRLLSLMSDTKLIPSLPVGEVCNDILKLGLEQNEIVDLVLQHIELYNQPCVLAMLAVHFSEPYKTKAIDTALALVFEIEDSIEQARIGVDILPYLPALIKKEVIQKVLVLAQGVPRDYPDFCRQIIRRFGLHAASPHKELVQRELDAERTIQRWALILTKLSQHVPQPEQEEIIEHVLTLVRSMKNSFSSTLMKDASGMSNQNITDMSAAMVATSLHPVLRLTKRLPEPQQEQILEHIHILTGLDIEAINSSVSSLLQVPGVGVARLQEIVTVQLEEELKKIPESKWFDFFERVIEGTLEQIGMMNSFRRNSLQELESTDDVEIVPLLVKLSMYLPEQRKSDILEETFATMERIIAIRKNGSNIRENQDFLHYWSKILELSSYLPDSFLHRSIRVTQLIGDNVQPTLDMLRQTFVPYSHLTEAEKKKQLSELLSNALKSDRSTERTTQFTAVIPHLTSQLCEEILSEICEAIVVNTTVVDSMLHLAKNVPLSLRHSVLRQLLLAIQQMAIWDRGFFGENLPFFPLLTSMGSLTVDQITTIFANFSTEYARNIANQIAELLKIIPILPENLFPDVLNVIQHGIKQEQQMRIKVKEAIVDSIPSLHPQKVSLIDEINYNSNEERYALFIIRIAPTLPQSLLPSVTALIRSLENEQLRVLTLAKLTTSAVESLKSEIVQEVIQATLQMTDKQERVETLALLTVVLDDPLKKKIAEQLCEFLSLSKSKEEDEKENLYIITNILNGILDGVARIEHERKKICRINRLAPYLPNVISEEFLPISKKYLYAIIHSERRRRAEFLHAIQDEDLSCDFSQQDQQQEENILFDIYLTDIKGLMYYLSEELFHNILFDARRFLSTKKQIKFIVDILPCSTEPLKEIILSELDKMIRESSFNELLDSEKYELLRQGFRFLPETILPFLLQTVESIESEHDRAEVSTVILARLPNSSFSEIQHLIKTFNEPNYRAEVLGALIDRLPKEEQSKVLDEELQSINEQDFHPENLERLVPVLVRLTRDKQYSFWRKILQDVVDGLEVSRPLVLNCIKSLIPIMFSLGGHQAIQETILAIEDVKRWWP